MKTSEQVDKIFPAIVRAQSQMETATANAVNPHFRSTYADLGEVWRVCKPALSANGLAVLQSPTTDGDNLTMITRIIHDSGQWVEGETSLPMGGKSTAQNAGSVITYARRYALASLLGVYLGDDDDANTTTTKPTPQPQRQPRQQQPHPNPAHMAELRNEVFGIAGELFGDETATKMKPMLSKMFGVKTSSELSVQQLAELRAHLIDIQSLRTSENGA